MTAKLCPNNTLKSQNFPHSPATKIFIDQLRELLSLFIQIFSETIKFCSFRSSKYKTKGKKSKIRIMIII